MTFSSQLGDQRVPAATAKPEQGFLTGARATTRSDFGSRRKTISVGLLLTQTESSAIASQSGEPGMEYWASGAKCDIGAWTPGTPGFGASGSCAIAQALAN